MSCCGKRNCGRGRKSSAPVEAIIEREKKEYRTADRVITLSTFAYKSFVEQGIPKEKLALLPLGVNVADFSATEEVVEARCRRIASGAPLRVLWVGTMSFQKGVLDYVEIVKALAGENFQFRFVGDIPRDHAPLADRSLTLSKLYRANPNGTSGGNTTGEMFSFSPPFRTASRWYYPRQTPTAFPFSRQPIAPDRI